MLRFIVITNLLLQGITYNVPPSWVPGRRHHAANTASAARELADLHAAHKAAMGMRFTRNLYCSLELFLLRIIV